MKSIKRFLAVAAAGVFLASGGVYLARTHRESERKHQARDPEMEELPQAGAGNVRRILPPRFLPVVDKAEETETTPNSSETDEGAPSPEQPKPFHLLRTHLEIAAKLRRILAQENRDPDWSTDTEKRVAVAFSKRLPEGSLIRSLECGSSMCLVELQQKNVAQFRQFVHDTLSNTVTSGDSAKFWGPVTAFITNKSDSGEVSAVVALAREGHDLPSLAE